VHVVVPAGSPAPFGSRTWAAQVTGTDAPSIESATPTFVRVVFPESVTRKPNEIVIPAAAKPVALEDC
jgi:hypothetical protein